MRVGAHLLVPPGLLYDSLFMIPRPNGVVWLNDDGGEENESGSRIVAVTHEGKVSVVVGLGKLLPVMVWVLPRPGSVSTRRAAHVQFPNSSSSALASFRSAVSKPSVNQP
jgi:hypothetical protein